ncbi:MAG: ACT domain-containing protein [Actinomycetota bacterium]|nr:ACT domain-containing protein [Actinomycetota bacterium]
MDTFVVRVWLPDRPGALGQVASRIGAVHGDVVGIEILERGGGSAIDDLTVALPDASLVDLLVAEIRQVDGVAVEDVRRVAADRPDGGMAALATAAAIVGATPDERMGTVCRQLRTLLDADWAVVLSNADAVAIAQCGEPPDIEWLRAFLMGSEHLDDGSEDNGDHEHTPGDLVWTRMPRLGAALACGRAGRVFHARERDEFRVLGTIVESLG